MDERQEALQNEYGEVCQNFRLLTDIRFRLLAFLPIATAVAIALENGPTTAPSLGLSLFGLVITLGLVTYNVRNDQLYNELVGRAATIERNLGLPDGGFAHRPRAWLVVDLPQVRWIPWKEWKVDHGTGVGTIYVASVALWLFGVIASALEYLRQTFVGLFPSRFILKVSADPSIWVNLTAFVLTVLVTYRVVKAIKHQRKDKSARMREAARQAVERATTLGLPELQNDDVFLRKCEELSREERDVIQTRLEFYASPDPDRLKYYMLQSSDRRVFASLFSGSAHRSARWVDLRLCY